MAIQLINVGETANDTTGDSLRTAFLKCNANFTELYNATSTGMRAWVLAETDYLAYNGDRILVDTSAGEVTITLPSTPVQGDWVQIADAWNFSVNNLLIVSAQTVEGFAEDIRIDIRGLFVEFIFSETTWKILTSLGVQGPPGPPGEIVEGQSYNINVVADDSTMLVDGLTATINLDGTVRGDIVPDQDSQYDLGSINNQWRSLYVSNNTIYLGGRPISIVGDTLAIGSDDGSTQLFVATQDYVATTIDTSVPQTLIDLGITEGAPGQVLTTNGAGVYTFETPADVSVVPYAEFTNRVNTVGEPYEFTKPSGTNLEDPIDTNLTLTRKTGAGGAIYNSALETEYDAITSPAGTLWNAEGWGNLDDVESRYYTYFKQVFRNKVGLNIIGKELVMYDTQNQKYYKVKFTQWDVGAGVGGGFQYTRQLLDTETLVGLKFADGSIQTTAPKDFWDEPQIFVGDTNVYTLGLADRGHHIYATNSSIEIPSNLQVPFPIGTTVRIITTDGPVNIIPCPCITPSVIYRNGFSEPSASWTITPYSSSTITKTDVNRWRLTSNDANASTIPADISDLTDTQGLLNGSGTSTVQPYLEITNVPFIYQPVTLGTPVTVTVPPMGYDAQVEVVISSGPVLDSVTVTTPGTGYVVGQRYRIWYYNIGGGNGEPSNITFVVATVGENGELLTVTNASFVGAASNSPGTYTTSIEYLSSIADNIDTGLSLVKPQYDSFYNIAFEQTFNYDSSPLATEWNADGWTNLVGFRSRTYSPLNSALGNDISANIVGAELIMHDTANNKYYKFDVTAYDTNGDGSYSYTRTEITDPNYFAKADYGSEIDVIVADDGAGAGVGITRGENNGIYNPYREGSWDGDVSPAGTEWNLDGWDDLSDVESRIYTNFFAAYGNSGLGNKVPGSKAVVYVPDNGKYYAIQWLSWTQNSNGGGFSYNRYELDLTKLNEGVKFPDGTVLKSAEGLGRVKSTASAGRRIEEITGNKTVSVTAVTTNTITAVASRSVVDDNRFWVSNTATDIAAIINNPNAFGVQNYDTIQFSLDNATWYSYTGSYSGTSTEIGVSCFSGPFTYNEGDTVYFRYDTGGAPVVWWNKADLPGGSANFRGAVIDYHAYTGEATWIGTIHIVDDTGNEHITHTEASSGASDSENDNLWIVNNEGTISYRRIDGESKTLRVQWTARVFYGTEFYD